MAYYESFVVDFNEDAAKDYPASSEDCLVTVRLKFGTTNPQDLLDAISKLTEALQHLISCNKTTLQNCYNESDGMADKIKQLEGMCDTCESIDGG